MIVILTVRTADQRGAAAGDRFDLAAAFLNIRHDLGSGKAVIVIVMGGVAHDLMPCIVEGLDRFGIFIYPVPHHKKSGFYVILCQNVDEVLGVLVAPR